jgi:CAAX prenyl protease-like protein
MRLSRSALVRVLPFVAFMFFLGLRGSAPEDGSWGFDPRWIYGAGVLAVGALLLAWRDDYGELFRQTLPDAGEFWSAVTIGLVVFALWIHLDAEWMSFGRAAAAFVPLDAHGQLDWPLVAVRWIGAVLLVPVMEELFWRSFLLRWIQQPLIEAVEPRAIGPRALVVGTFLFVLAHTLWLAAVIAGLTYALLYMRTGKLWVAVIAHAVTNAALGVWVVAGRHWQFW